MRNLWMLAMGCVLLAGCMLVERRAPESIVQTLEPPPLLDATTQQLERWILVKKSARTLSVFDGDRLLKRYPIVLGATPVGQKQHEGDHRTPEGEYHIADKYHHSRWSRFMLIDYPTPVNRDMYVWNRDMGLLPVRGRDVASIGGAIGIHGTKDDGLNRVGINWTQGCISLVNEDAKDLYDITPLGTRVVIEP